MNNYVLFSISAVAGYILSSLVWRADSISHHSGSVSGWFKDTGGKGPGQHGAECAPHSPGCVCTDMHKCTPDAKIAGVNLFKQGWLPSKPGDCRPELSIYGANYFDSNCCPDGTYGGPPRKGPFNVSCRGVVGIGGGYQG